MLKKILVVCFIFSLIMPALAGSTPVWSDFCPAEYVEPIVLTTNEIDIKAQELANKKTKVFYCKSDKLYAKILRGITILPALDCWCGNKIAKNNFKIALIVENEKNLYWADRKKQFLHELNNCTNLSQDAKGMCYLKINEIEYKKNDNLKQQQKLDAINTQLWLNNMINKYK